MSQFRGVATRLQRRSVSTHLPGAVWMSIRLFLNDLHKLEEAEGHETLMREHHYRVDEPIAKLGWSRAYVYTRLKLLAAGRYPSG